MTDFYNWQKHKNIRRTLRKTATKAERLLWSRIRNRKLQYKFRRQYSIGNYVLDFYCPQLNFAIEVDGATHSNEKEVRHDMVRQKYIENLGIKIKRIKNSDIYENLDEVVSDIKDICNSLAKK